MDEKNAPTLESVPLVDEHGIEQAQKRLFYGRDRRRDQYLRFFLLFLVLEIINIGLLVGIPSLVRKREANTIHDSIDELKKIHSQYNRKWVWDTAEGDDHGNFLKGGWENITLEPGFVSLKKDVVQKHGIPLSGETPNRPGEMVYQVAAFHGLHCLVLIREQLMKGELSAENPHIWHCFNYLRQSMMCNVDLQLNVRGGDELLGFDNEVHVCRNYDAIVSWIDANRWENFWNWHFANGVLG